MANILVVDDELGIRDLLFEILNDEGHAVELAENAAQARQCRSQQRPDLVLLDIWMPDTDGVTLLKEWASTGQLNMPVVMMSGHATIETAVEATRIGAMSFLEKPITLQKLLQSVDAALNKPAPKLMAKPASGMALVGADAPRLSTVGTENDPGYALQDSYVAPNATGSATVFDMDAPLRDARDAFEKAYFEYHLLKEQGSMTRVAEKTGLERTHLYRKLKQLGVDLNRAKRAAG